jgi:molybdate transport system ATP-binding protein
MIEARIGKKLPGFSLDVEFSFAPGVTALYGPSRAGKTLLLEMLAGFVAPDSGRILLDDALLFDAATRVHLPACGRGCAYVAARGALFPHMNLRRNLLFAARRSPRVERARRVAEMLERFQLTALAASRPRDLDPRDSLRAEAARALLASPKALLLDERGYGEPLLRLVRETFSGPILLVSGDLDSCCAADSMVLLSAGSILQSGPPRAVLDRPESVDAARLLGIPNIFECVIAALDPGRGSSRLELPGFAIDGPYPPGHFRGDRVSVAVDPANLRVHSGELERRPNAVPAALVRAMPRARTVRLEFSGGVFVDVTNEEFERQKDNKAWQVEFPPQALRVL